MTIRHVCSTVCVVVLAASLNDAVAQDIRDLAPMDAQTAGAYHDLYMQNTRPTNTRLRVCNPVPKDERILNSLKYDSDNTMVPMTGLSHGVAALSARHLRASWCIEPPPSKFDVKSWNNWYFRNFVVTRPATGSDIFGPMGPPTRAHRSIGQNGMISNGVQAASYSGEIWADVVTTANTIGTAEQKLLFNNAGITFQIPNFTLPAKQKTAAGLCNAIWLDQSYMWVGLGGYDNGNGSLLQAGIQYKLGCSGLNANPFPSLNFFVEFLPAEQGTLPAPFPVQIRTTDNVYAGVYWLPTTSPNQALYSTIDITLQKGVQFSDPNPGNALLSNSVEAAYEEPERAVINGVTKYYVAPLSVTNPLSLQLAQFQTNLSGSEIFNIGVTKSIAFPTDKVPLNTFVDSTTYTAGDGDLGLSNLEAKLVKGLISFKEIPAN